MDLLASLADPSLYHRQDNVPVFCVHRAQKKMSDGTVQEIVVNAKDLQEIADRNNARLADRGVPAILTLGHRFRDAGVPETEQPPVVGASIGWRVGAFGPKRIPCLYVSEYVRQEHKETVGKGFPFRSCEYYPGKKEITAVACLKRDPELDLGMTVYASGSDSFACYSREVNPMPFGKDAPGGDPPADAPGGDPPLPAGDPVAPPTPEAPPEMPPPDPSAEYEKACYGHPGASAYYAAKCAQYGAGAGAAAPAAAPAAPAMPGATNMSGAKPEPLPFARDAASAQYARMEAELRTLKEEQAKDRAARLAAEAHARSVQYDSELAELENAGIIMDRKAELGLCVSYSREQFDFFKKRIVANYQRTPVGGRLLAIAPAPQDEPEFDQARLEESLAYAREHGVSVEEAVKKVLKRK